MTTGTNRTPDVAVLGLGIIGGIWARHLASDGRLAAAWNRTPRPDFPGWVATPAAAAERADTLIVVVADPPAVETVLRDLGAKIGAQHLIIQSSTIDPAASRRFGDWAAARGAAYVEAPFTGSKPAAEARRVVYYLGGAPAAIARAQPVLERLSEKRFVIGDGPQAATLKLACNIQIAAQLEVLCEALAWCRKAGIADDVFFSALRSNAAWSGLVQLKEPKLRAGDYAPHFSAKHMLKDLRLALAAASESRLPVAQTVAARLQAVRALGLGDEDMSALYCLLK